MTTQQTNIGFRPMQHVTKPLNIQKQKGLKKKWQFWTQHKVDGLEKQRKGLQFYTNRKLTIPEESLMV